MSRSVGRSPDGPARVRIAMPYQLRHLARVSGEVQVEVDGPVTLGADLDELEAADPTLRGPIRDRRTGQRWAMIRIYADGEDLSDADVRTLLPNVLRQGQEPLRIVGAIVGADRCMSDAADRPAPQSPARRSVRTHRPRRPATRSRSSARPGRSERVPSDCSRYCVCRTAIEAGVLVADGGTAPPSGCGTALAAARPDVRVARAECMATRTGHRGSVRHASGPGRSDRRHPDHRGRTCRRRACPTGPPAAEPQIPTATGPISARHEGSPRGHLPEPHRIVAARPDHGGQPSQADCIACRRCLCRHRWELLPRVGQQPLDRRCRPGRRR